MPVIFEDVFMGGVGYDKVTVGPVDHPSPVMVVAADLPAEAVDRYGWLKPGTPFTRTGAAALGGTPGAVYGVVIEETRIARSNSAEDLADAGTVDVIVATICQVNRRLLEGNLGRALTTAEAAAFDAAGSRVVLIPHV